MKLTQNGENTLRISLSAEDLEAYRLSPEELDYDKPSGRRIIRELFKAAKEHCGFDCTAERVYIQLYPKKDGGCELFVIRLEENAKKECYLIPSLEAYLAVRSLFRGEDAPIFYRVRQKERFFVLAPSERIPPRLGEFAEKQKRTPSRTFLKSRCVRVRDEE
ncbi:MAG: adaptor protein MecA [Clostridia bacterium]|nr:adaptor protein MecA [Clostridia bacterium]